MADNHEDKRIVSFETEFDRELATNSNNKKQQVMKTKLSVLLLYLCSLTLFAACSNNRQKQKTPAENVATPIRNFLKQKYPAATILKSEKETNGTEVDIQEKSLHKEVWFDTKEQWVSTHWEISARDVPAAIMDALQNSAYNQYKIEDITAIERPDGLFYDFELKQDNNEIHIILDSEAKIVDLYPPLLFKVELFPGINLWSVLQERFHLLAFGFRQILGGRVFDRQRLVVGAKRIFP